MPKNGDLNIFNPHPTIISQMEKQKDLSGPSKILSKKHIKVAKIQIWHCYATGLHL